MTNLAGKPEFADKEKELLALFASEQKKYGGEIPLTVANPKPAEWSPPSHKGAKK